MARLIGQLKGDFGAADAFFGGLLQANLASGDDGDFGHREKPVQNEQAS
jgi:hypothetical protein